jgi:hypothetical protein
LHDHAGNRTEHHESESLQHFSLDNDPSNAHMDHTWNIVTLYIASP